MTSSLKTPTTVTDVTQRQPIKLIANYDEKRHIRRHMRSLAVVDRKKLTLIKQEMSKRRTALTRQQQYLTYSLS